MQLSIKRHKRQSSAGGWCQIDYKDRLEQTSKNSRWTANKTQFWYQRRMRVPGWFLSWMIVSGAESPGEEELEADDCQISKKGCEKKGWQPFGDERGGMANPPHTFMTLVKRFNLQKGIVVNRFCKPYQRKTGKATITVGRYGACADCGTSGGSQFRYEYVEQGNEYSLKVERTRCGGVGANRFCHRSVEPQEGNPSSEHSGKGAGGFCSRSEAIPDERREVQASLLASKGQIFQQEQTKKDRTSYMVSWLEAVRGVKTGDAGNMFDVFHVDYKKLNWIRGRT